MSTLTDLQALMPQLCAASQSLEELIPNALDWTCNSTDNEIEADVLAQCGPGNEPVADLIKACRDLDLALGVLTK